LKKDLEKKHFLYFFLDFWHDSCCMLSGLCCYDMSLSSFTRGRYQVELSGMIISTQAKPSKDIY